MCSSDLWLIQDLPRRGLVAGLYPADPLQPGGALELLPPRLYREPTALDAAASDLSRLHPAFTDAPPQPAALRCPAQVHQPQDVAELLRFSQEAAAAGRPAPWGQVLPLYPTSPVDRVGP